MRELLSRQKPENFQEKFKFFQGDLIYSQAQNKKSIHIWGHTRLSMKPTIGCPKYSNYLLLDNRLITNNYSSWIGRKKNQFTKAVTKIMSYILRQMWKENQWKKRVREHGQSKKISSTCSFSGRIRTFLALSL